MADSDGGQPGDGDVQRGGEHGLVAQDGGAGSFWSACDWLPCIDGKARPVEPGTFPLAHGVAARVGRLRAYGNAIVAPAAEAFIQAYREARGY
jgi:DNA (cytosine-5)-methyltransferase 1